MNEIGIYHKTFPRVSMQFVSEQARNLVKYSPTFILCTLLQEIPFQKLSISQTDFLKIKQVIYLLTRSPILFGNLDALKNLKLIHAHFGPDGVYAMELAKTLKIPFLVTFHGYDITISRQEIWRTGKFLYYQLLFHEEKLKEQASALIAVSHFIRKKLIEEGYPEEKIILHHIGVDTEKFTPAANETGERYVLCIGRHTPKKGIDTLLRAFARLSAKHPHVSLLQVGAGPMTAELQTLVQELGISSRVRFLGAQPHETVLKLMQGAEIFALSSQTAPNGDCEGLPIVINEASACAIPVVSTWHSGIPEAVLDGETGFLVPERDDTALAEKIDILLSDRDLGKQMGRRGRKLACEEFDIRKQTAKLEEIYDAIAQRAVVV